MDTYNAHEAALLLKCSYGQICHLLRIGKLSGFKAGRSWVIRKYSLDIYMDEQEKCFLQEAWNRKDKKKCQSTNAKIFGGLSILTPAVSRLDDLLKHRTKG